MKKKIKEQWIEALRSGEYQQTAGCLHSENGFCCLGVLTDLYLKEFDEDWTAGDPSDEVLSYHIDGEYNYLLEDVKIWAGLDSESPMIVMQDSKKTALANLNDEGKTFDEIAQIIEEKL